MRLTLVRDGASLAGHRGGPERRGPLSGTDVAELRSELAQLREEVAVLRAALGDATAATRSGPPAKKTKVAEQKRTDLEEPSEATAVMKVEEQASPTFLLQEREEPPPPTPTYAGESPTYQGDEHHSDSPAEKKAKKQRPASSSNQQDEEALQKEWAQFERWDAAMKDQDSNSFSDSFSIDDLAGWMKVKKAGRDQHPD